MSTNNYDTFDDIRHGGMGLFDGAQGAAAVDAVAHKALPDGLALEFMCQGCGKQRRLIMDYAELVAICYGFSPAVVFRGTNLCHDPSHWTYRTHPENAWGLNMRCNTGGCEYHYPVRLTQREALSYLQRAKKEMFIDPRGEGIIKQHCKMALQRGMPRQGPHG